MKFNRCKHKAFTLIELLVVIAIIGILATLAVVALQQARSRARDSKRVADVKQVQTALELFFNENGRYPTNEEWDSGSILSSTTGEVFMHNIPSAPTPADGDCLEASNTYEYVQINNGSSYEISFCLGKQLSNLPDGPKCLTPGGIISSDCSTERYVAPEYTEIKYGALYNWYVVLDSRLISNEMKNQGWVVPTYQNYNTLRDYIGGSTVAGGMLKDAGFDYWNSPNTGATNDFGFNGRGGGFRSRTGFSNLNIYSYLGTNSLSGGVNWIFFRLSYNSSQASTFYTVDSSNFAYSLRFFRPPLQDDIAINDGDYSHPYIGNDGKIYQTIKIGNQVWMAEDLVETKWSDSTNIQLVTDNTQWSNLTTPAMCYYNNDESNALMN